MAKVIKSMKTLHLLTQLSSESYGISRLQEIGSLKNSSKTGDWILKREYSIQFGWPFIFLIQNFHRTLLLACLEQYIHMTREWLWRCYFLKKKKSLIPVMEAIQRAASLSSWSSRFYRKTASVPSSSLFLDFALSLVQKIKSILDSFLC